MSKLPGMSENLRNYTRSVYSLDAVVRRVPEDAWDNQSPCTEWTAREVLGHVIWGMNRVAAGVGAGEEPIEAPEAEVAGDDPVATWDEASRRVLEGLDHQGVLQLVRETPFGEMPVDGLLGFVYSDVLMHTWDIATAVGIEHGIADDLADRAHDLLAGAGDGIRGPGMMDPAVEPPAEADAAGRMAAMGGRTA